jgi:hypothetical protein
MGTVVAVGAAVRHSLGKLSLHEGRKKMKRHRKSDAAIASPERKI